MAYSFLFGDSKGDKKKPYWLLSGVCRPRPVIFKSLHPLLLLSNPPPITSLHFFSRWFFFFSLGDFFFSPLLAFLFHPRSIETSRCWCAVWSSDEGKRENERKLQAYPPVIIQVLFFYPLLSSFLFLFLFPPFFFLTVGWSKKKKIQKNNR